jgi:hypothetical protein
MKQKYIKYDLSDALFWFFRELNKPYDEFDLEAVHLIVDEIVRKTGMGKVTFIDYIKPGMTDRNLFYAILGDMQKRKIDTRGIV